MVLGIRLISCLIFSAVTILVLILGSCTAPTYDVFQDLRRRYSESYPQRILRPKKSSVQEKPLLSAETDASLLPDTESQYLIEQESNALSISDPAIVIFSPSHDTVSYVKNRKGIIKFNISTFYPVLSVYINGSQSVVPKETKIEIDYPFKIESAEKELVVTVETEKGIGQKTFTIKYGKESGHSNILFDLISLIGISNIDNINNVPDYGIKESAIKTNFVLIPQLSFKFGSRSRLAVKCLFFKDKFSDDAYAFKEISYSQIAGRWIQKKLIFQELEVGLGINDIRTYNNSIFSGEHEASIEQFILVGIKDRFWRKVKWDLSIQYKLKDSKIEITNENDDPDGGEIKLSTGAAVEFLGLQTRLEVGYSEIDALGRYRDEKNSRTGLKLKYPVGDFIPSISATVRETQMKNKDLRRNLTPQSTTNSSKVQLGYKLLRNTRLIFSVQQMKKLSNVESESYSTLTTLFSLTHLF